MSERYLQGGGDCLWIPGLVFVSGVEGGLGPDLGLGRVVGRRPYRDAARPGGDGLPVDDRLHRLHPIAPEQSHGQVVRVVLAELEPLDLESLLGQSTTSRAQGVRLIIRIRS